MKTALVIMAAGMGSRFGSGIKQLAEVGPSGEIIMDIRFRRAAASRGARDMRFFPASALSTSRSS